MTDSTRETRSRYRKYIIDIKKYKTIKDLESGGFGSVCSVENTETGDILAAKVLDTHKDDKSYKRMINREIGIMIRCQHPTIIKFEGYSLRDFNDKNNVMIFMELAKKGSLADYLKKVQNGLVEDTYDNTNRQIILVGVARGMMHLHQHQVIHRDLKPGNILLDEQLHPHITDFGLSKINEGGSNNVSQSQTCGTSMYMAPECIDGSRYNGKADVYSFGILMYEVVTDTSPYPLLEKGKMSAFKFNKKVIDEDYRPEFTIPVKKSIKKLIERCWSRDPQDRPTFEELFKKLAYNIEDSIDDIYDDQEVEAGDDEKETTEEDNSYYLDDVDVDEVMAYADDIDNAKPSSSSDADLLAKVESLIKPIIDENNKMKKQLEEIRQENEQLKGHIEETDDKISNISSKSKKSGSSDSDDEKEEEDEADSNSLKSQIQSIKEFVREMKTDMVDQDDLDDKLEELKNEFNEKLEKLEKNLGNNNKNDKSDNEDIEEINDNIKELKRANAELKKTNSQILKDYADLKKDNEDIKKKLSQIEKQINSISNNTNSNQGEKPPKKEGRKSDLQTSSKSDLHHSSSKSDLQTSSKSVDLNQQSELSTSQKQKQQQQQQQSSSKAENSKKEPENSVQNKTEDSQKQLQFKDEVSEQSSEIMRSSDFNKSKKSLFSKRKSKTTISNAPKEPIDPNKITIGDFNELPLQYQHQTMSDIIAKTPGGKANPFFQKSNDFLDYLYQYNQNGENCFEICTGTPEKTLCRVKGEHQVRLLSQATEVLLRTDSFDWPTFNEMITKFNGSSIEIKYPSKKYDTAYDIFTYLQGQQKGRVKLAIFLTKSDLKFKGDEHINIVKVDSSVSTLEGDKKTGGCFENCKNLLEVTFSESVTAIESCSFRNCPSLSRIKLPLSLKRIGSYAFSLCTSLKEIVIPNSVTEIKQFTFDQCRNLKQVTLPESLTLIGSKAFSSTSIESLVIPNSVTEIGDGAFEECKHLKEINIPTSCVTVGDYAFKKCKALKAVSFPNTLKKLGTESFIECTSLQEVTFAVSISTISDLAFMKCTSLTQITLPSSVTAIGNQSFRGCTSLTKALFPIYLKSIGDFAFAECSALQLVMLPKSAKQIGGGAFPEQTKVIKNK